MDLLDQFKQSRTHIAFVVDEYGSLEGLVTIQDIFDLCQADSPDAVRAGEYVWEISQPLREGHEYRVSGSITEVHRKVGKRGGVMDFVTFVADVCETHDDVPCARISNTWIFLRGEA